MRIWSLHPKYLDAKGLVALWRETLLAKHVLENKTKGYRNHPQLKRFKNHPQPLEAINYYLSIVFKEAEKRGFEFSKEKINWNFEAIQITVTKGQVEYEMKHLKKKLKQRDPFKLKAFMLVKNCEVHPLFIVVEGEVEDWEVITK
jgi:hypothetical protein